MAPILIDGRDLLKLGFISALTAFFIFSAGFLFGHQKAASFYIAESQPEPLFLPEKVASVENDIAPQVPEIIDAGEEIDVDQPALESKTMTHMISAIEPRSEIRNMSFHDSALAVDNESADTSLVVNQNLNTEGARIQFASIGAIVSEVSESNISKNAGNEVSAYAGTDEVQEHQAILVSSFTPDELNKIKYSIQVGMYGRLINAENMMEVLQAKQLNAYVSDYTNKNDEVRYNVRFGYFADKKAALTALKAYKSNQNGDGYLVKFSVENIINIARATNREQSDIIEEKNEGLTPVTKPSDIIHETDLSVDTVSTADILMKTHVEILAETQIEMLAK